MSRPSRPSSVLPSKTPNVRDHYKMRRKLGQGLFGATYLCTETATGKQYACKSIPKRRMMRQEEFEAVLREVEIMRRVAGHPNVVRIKEAYEDAQAVHLVMELCAGGELLERMVRRGQYSEREASRLMRTIVGVVDTCHSLGVVHRDLKLENLLFLGDDEEAALKVIDFGRSVFYKPGDKIEDLVGELTFVAPEAFKEQYGPEADVWSAGVILYILLSGAPPFSAESEREMTKEILYGKLDLVSAPWLGISDSAKDLIRNMLNRNPKERFTAHQVLSHPWIVDDSVASDKPLDSAIISRLKQFSAMNKLKKMALKVIAENLSEEEIGSLKELFKIIDADNSGTITYDELKEGLRKVGSQLTESEIQELIDAADIDSSGTIDYGEFIAATMQMNKMDKEEHLISAFAYFDKDSSGFITIDELRTACAEFGLSETHLDEIIRDIDENNDGKIDYAEFAAMMRKGIGGPGKTTVKNNLAGLGLKS